jgi:glycosyltransferase involved in cell wall biosynthesis
MGKRHPGTGPKQDEFTGTLLFGIGLIAAASLNFAYSSAMGRMLDPPVFGTLGVYIAALVAVIGPVNALSGGTEMFAALRNRFPRGRKRFLVPALGLLIWAGCMLSGSPTVRSVGWFSLGGGVMILLAWNRGALIGLGRFTFVGVSFAFEGVGRIALALLLVALGLGLEGASAGLALGMLGAFIMTEVAVPKSAPETREPLGREVWIALFGLFALGLTQIVDVFAIRLANPAASGAYVGAASLARIALFSQMPAAAYALRRAAVEGPRRALPKTLVLALIPGAVAILAVEVFPRLLLHLAYGSRFLGSVGTLRILGLAMLLGGFATVAAQLLMGHRSTAWVWSVVPTSALGTAAIITMAHAPTSVAIFSVAIQGCVLLAVAAPALAILREAGDSGTGGVLIMNWRDTRHPQGGGSEVYVEQVAGRLAEGGRTVTVFCAAHPNAPPQEIVDGVRFIRRGTWRTVYAWGFLYHLIGRFGPHDATIDVKNGIPFFAPLYCRQPVVCLVHHIHREQWPMNFSPRQARLGWWLESRVSTRLYRDTPHVAVSESTKLDLVELGVRPDLIDVVHNGSDPTALATTDGKAPVPTVAFLGRLVPHKRVEWLFDAAARIRPDLPELRVVVIGQGPWEPRLREHAADLGLSEVVTFTGWVDEETKRRLLGEAWALALPSVKEGWGLSVMEAAVLGTPAVAFAVGGLSESIVSGSTGLLVDEGDLGGFAEALQSLLLDSERRLALGAEAARRASTFSWEVTASCFEARLREAVIAPPLHAPTTPLQGMPEGLVADP